MDSELWFYSRGKSYRVILVDDLSPSDSPDMVVGDDGRKRIFVSASAGARHVADALCTISRLANCAAAPDRERLPASEMAGFYADFVSAKKKITFN